MTTHDHADHDLPFTENEVQDLHAEDYKAAIAVVGLMLGIFCIGVILYAIVLISVAA